MKGVVFTCDGRMYVKNFGEPLYQTVGEAVDGWIEVVHPEGLQYPFCFICNEEGMLRNLPVNPIGCLWYGTLKHGWPILGTIVVMKEGDAEEGPDIVGLTAAEIEEVKALAVKLSGGVIVDADLQEG